MLLHLLPFAISRCAPGDLSGWYGKLPQHGQIDLTICRTEEQRDMRGRNLGQLQNIDDLVGYSLLIYKDSEELALADITFIGGEDLQLMLC